MSEIHEVAESTIQKVLDRVDALAVKLGIAATEVWEFSVKARAVEARAEMMKAAGCLLIPLVLFIWAGHVSRIEIPREIKYVSVCQQMQQGWESCQTDKSQPQKGDLTAEGDWYVFSGFAAFIAGVLTLLGFCGGIIDSYASIKTVEYDAYQDLLYDWKG